MARQTPLGARPNRNLRKKVISYICGPHIDSGRSLEVYGDIHPREMIVHDRIRLTVNPQKAKGVKSRQSTMICHSMHYSKNDHIVDCRDLTPCLNHDTRLNDSI